TSDYYRAEVEEWVAKFNAGRPADAWWDKPWERLRPDLDYAKYSSPDDAPGEGLGVYQGRVFPHPLNGGLNEIGERYYEAVYNSPFSNELLWSLAKTAITENRLGADDDVDLLSISFSGNDAVGHTWGPDSQEALDTTLRSDAIVAEILKTLDEKVGAGRYLVALTADHGVCPLTQYSAAHGVDASRMPSDQLREGADRMLTAKFFPNETQPKKWIAASDNNWHYLNQAVVQAAQAETAAVESELANWLMQQPGVAKAYTRTAFINHTLPDDEFAKAASLSFDADRCGDVMIVLQPNWLWVYGDNSGTTHGSPHPYDTWVPLVVFGHGVKPGNRQEKVAPLTIGPIFSQALGFPAPAQTEFPAPANLWKTEAKNAK
ncbi:MAG TPA: alkaline phosphatase family protein, partial [Pirellulales bacterium]